MVGRGRKRPIIFRLNREKTQAPKRGKTGSKKKRKVITLRSSSLLSKNHFSSEGRAGGSGGTDLGEKNQTILVKGKKRIHVPYESRLLGNHHLWKSEGD